MKKIVFTTLVLAAMNAYSAAPYVTVRNPNATTLFDPTPSDNGVIKVEWVSGNFPANWKINIDISPNNGTSWRRLISNTANDGAEQITFSAARAQGIRLDPSPRLLVRVVSTNDPNTKDTSDKTSIMFGKHYKTISGNFIYGGYCTDHSAKQFELTGGRVDWNAGGKLGNAEVWFDKAKAMNATRVSTAIKDGKPGNIIVWSYNGFGHVANIIEFLDSQNTSTTDKAKYAYVRISEMNYGASIKEDTLYSSNAVTESFGKITTAVIPIGSLNRGNLKYKGVILR